MGANIDNSENSSQLKDDWNFEQHGQSSISHFEDDENYDINIREILLVIRRRKEVILGITGLSLVLVLIFLFLQTPLYTASSMIQINVRSTNVVDFESVVSGISFDEPAIGSEIDILKSRYLASRVIDKLNLTSDEEFNLEAGKSTFAWLYDALSIEEETEEEREKRKKVDLTNTIDVFLKRSRILRKPRSYTIDIQFNSQSPEKAALIANTITEEYLVSQLSSKFDATKRANDWLNNKIADLQKKVHQSEMTVQMFKEQNELIETAGMTVSDQQLSELNTQLILSGTDLAQAQARLRGAEDSVDSSSEVLGSALIQSLREQEAKVVRKKSELSNRYGARHPKMINVNAELRDLRSNIKVEIDKIKSGLRKEVEIAKAREDSLKKSLRKLQGKVGTSTKARVQLAELTREMNANRSLYESFLVRSKETFHNKDLEQADAKVISSAEIPLKPSYPRKKLMFAIALIIGSGLGIVFAFLVEHLDNAFKTSRQLEKITGVASIGMAPELDARTNFVAYVVTKLSSVFVESIRSILTSIHFSNPDNIPKSILITSSVPDEGKTTLAVTLASVAAKSGKKVLLVDCDFKKPAVAKKFTSKEIKYCIGNYLTGDATEKQVVNIDERSGLHFVSSHADTANSQDLLSSQKMKDFIEQMSKKYDLVVLDSPPIMAVSDAVIAARIVDTVLFVVRWNKTPRQIVKTAIKQLKCKDVRLAGTVLTCVNLDKYSKYGYGDQGYYYKNYKEYYSG